MDPQELTLLLAAWGYPALFALFLLTGVGSPVPEDLLLLLAGYLVFLDVFTLPLTFFISWSGVIGSDFVLFAAGRHLAWHSSRWTDDHMLSPTRLRRASRWFERCGDIAIFFARLVPGTRAVVFLTAGVRDVPARRFVACDAAGALVWVPVMLWAGHGLGHRIGDLTAALEWLRQGAVWGLLLAASLLVAWLVMGREESKL